MDRRASASRPFQRTKSGQIAAATSSSGSRGRARTTAATRSASATTEARLVSSGAPSRSNVEADALAGAGTAGAGAGAGTAGDSGARGVIGAGSGLERLGPRYLGPRGHEGTNARKLSWMGGATPPASGRVLEAAAARWATGKICRASHTRCLVRVPIESRHGCRRPSRTSAIISPLRLQATSARRLSAAVQLRLPTVEFRASASPFAPLRLP